MEEDKLANVIDILHGSKVRSASSPIYRNGFQA